MSISQRTLAAAAALLLVGSLAPSVAAPPQRTAERGVRLALIRLNRFLAKRDPAIVDEFMPKDGALLIGASAAETAQGRGEIAAHFANLFAEAETRAFAWRRVEVSVRNSVAWLFAEGEIVRHGPAAERREPYRLSGVLEQHGGRWLWRLFHGSQPVA